MNANIKNRLYDAIKHGENIEVINQILKEEHKSLPPDFVTFMQNMFDKYGKKKKDIANITGISTDYLYKVLNGSKKTNERDYIIAICIATGMNHAETQHALTINNMHTLDESDLRDLILSRSIIDKRSFHDINESLENANLPYIRVNKDMEKYVPQYEFNNTSDKETEKARAVDENNLKNDVIVYHEIDRKFEAEKCGDALFDYIYYGNIFLEDNSENKYIVCGYYSSLGDFYYTMDEENYIKFTEYSKDDASNDEPTWHSLEEFDGLDEALNSKFIKYYIDIYNQSNRKVEEIMRFENDTANFGTRIGARIENEGLVQFIESYYHPKPAYKLYLQVVDNNGDITYSASHESAYLQFELDNLYDIYFEDNKKVDFFIKVKDEDDMIGIPRQLQNIFHALLYQLHIALNEDSGGQISNDDKLFNENITVLAELAAAHFKRAEYQDSLDCNKQMLELLKSKEMLDDELRAIIVSTLYKCVMCELYLGNNDDSKNYMKQIIDHEDFVELTHNIENKSIVIECLTDALLYYAQSSQNNGNIENTKFICEKIITYLEDNCDSDKKYQTLFCAYVKLANILDDENNDECALSNYEKAYKLLRKQHLERKGYEILVIHFLNNYGWVLWHRHDSDEAIIIYNKALEILEDCIEERKINSDESLEILEHISMALVDIYDDENKAKEAEKIVERYLETKEKIENI